MTHTFLPRRLPPLDSPLADRLPCTCAPSARPHLAAPCPVCKAWSDEGRVLLVDGTSILRHQWLAYYEAPTRGEAR